VGHIQLFLGFAYERGLRLRLIGHTLRYGYNDPLSLVSLSAAIAMLLWILPIMKGFGRTGQERGQRPRSKIGTIFRLTRIAPAYYPAAYHHHRRHEQRASAAHPRPEAPPQAGRAGDLGPATAESSARGRAGSQLYHVPSAPPPWRASERQACMQTETGVGLPLSTMKRARSMPCCAMRAIAWLIASLNLSQFVAAQKRAK
jgi:hypothetical protein